MAEQFETQFKNSRKIKPVLLKIKMAIMVHNVPEN
jgi:hypothetical protein